MNKTTKTKKPAKTGVIHVRSLDKEVADILAVSKDVVSSRSKVVARLWATKNKVRQRLKELEELDDAISEVLAELEAVETKETPVVLQDSLAEY